jgi:hypothetical protein
VASLRYHIMLLGGTLFKLGINETGAMKGFYNQTGDYVKVPPLGVFDFSSCRMPSGFSPVSNFAVAMRHAKQRFYVQRSFALGDVLTTVPAVRAMCDAGLNAMMRVSGSHASMMEMLEVPYLTTNHPVDNMPGLITDWLYERDVSDPALGRLHRYHTAMMALGMNTATPPDWSVNVDRFPALPFATPKLYVVMVGHGSGPRKRLPVTTIERMLARLNEAGVMVYYNGGPVGLRVTARTALLNKQLSPTQLFTLIHRAAALVTVDTGPLWIAHYTATPTVAILGPSHWRQRLALHPLWPEGAEAIQMNEWMNCESCHENSQRCGGKYRCLTGDADRLATEVMERVIKYEEITDGN